MKTPLLSALVVALACGPASALGLVRVSATRVGPQHIASGVVPRGLSLRAGKPGLLPQSFGGTPLLQVAPELRQGPAFAVANDVAAVGVDTLRTGPAASVAARLKNVSFALGEAGESLQNKDSSGIHGAGAKLEQTVTGETYAYRPPVEWWTVGTRRFDSTQALLASGVADKGPVPAVHHYRPSPARIGAGRWLGSAAGGLAAGGFFSAFLGFLFASFGAILGTVTLTSITADADILSGAVFFGAFGAVAGLLAALRGMHGLSKNGVTREGVLTKENGALIFTAGRRVADLARHAGAEVLLRRKVPLWRTGMLLGALVVPAFLLLSFVPLVNVVVPLAVGGIVGRSLASGRNALYMLPEAAGAAVAGTAAIAVWAGISSLGWVAMAPWLIGATAVLALSGALLGEATMWSGMDYAMRVSGSWWSDESDDPKPAPKKR